jgi:hypothetical protein
MNEELKARAMRAAVAVLDELGTTPTTHDELITALAVAWLDGNNAGLADALAIAGDPVSA